ncbi:MAG: glycosyltransferase family 2 protein [Armatimonadetes bacterium]|nr:glycosyltransferase family 2 protein [Armatimonadota bacterium]
MKISSVITTYNREELLARAVKSVLTQDCDANFEIIVMNDAGKALSHADWQNDPRVRIYTTNRAERSYARNAGIAMPKGNTFIFLLTTTFFCAAPLRHYWRVPRIPAQIGCRELSSLLTEKILFWKH